VESNVVSGCIQLGVEITVAADSFVRGGRSSLHRAEANIGFQKAAVSLVQRISAAVIVFGRICDSPGQEPSYESSAEDDQRSEKNSPCIYQGVMVVLRRHKYKVGSAPRKCDFVGDGLVAAD